MTVLVVGRRAFDTRLAVVGGQAHALAAVDEMSELASELAVILRRTGVESAASDRAFTAIESWARRPLRSGPTPPEESRQGR